MIRGGGEIAENFVDLKRDTKNNEKGRVEKVSLEKIIKEVRKIRKF